MAAHLPMLLENTLTASTILIKVLE